MVALACLYSQPLPYIKALNYIVYCTKSAALKKKHCFVLCPEPYKELCRVFLSVACLALFVQ